MFKNKILITVVAVAVALIVVAGGGFYILSKNSSQSAAPTPGPEAQQQILTMNPEDIGMKLSQVTYTKKSPPGPALRLEITKLDGIKSIDCEIHYSHATDTGDRTTEGLLCNIDIKPGTSSITQDFPYATCSDVCHYQKDIKGVEAIVKVTKSDGKIYQIDQKLADQ